MSERRSVLLALAPVLILGGGSVLIFKATERGQVSWWIDPVSWIGAMAVVAGVALFAWFLIPPWLTDRRVRQEREEQLLLQGQANQRLGLEQILGELGQISGQLKTELRWGKRGGLFPNAAWTRYHDLIGGEARALVESAYGQAYELGEATVAATKEDLDPEETARRQEVKETVDAAFDAVCVLRDEVSP